MTDPTDHAEIPPAMVIDAEAGFDARFHLTPADEVFATLVREGHLTLKAYVYYSQKYDVA